MTWKPSEDMDRQVRSWLKAKGWGVTRTNYDSEREVYAWRHDVRDASHTLRISRQVLKDYPLSWCSPPSQAQSCSGHAGQARGTTSCRPERRRGHPRGELTLAQLRGWPGRVSSSMCPRREESANRRFRLNHSRRSRGRIPDACLLQCGESLLLTLQHQPLPLCEVL